MKAAGLFSGGLDSLLAIKLIQKQGIDVVAIAFRSPFFIANEEKKKKLKESAKRNGFRIKFIEFGKDYLDMLKKPKHGYGKNMNPCIDCHAFMLKKAKQYANKIDAKFIFTGEVLDERPMSQNMKSLSIVEEEAGLKGRLLRPLSAKLLPETEAEKKGFVDRDKLLDIRGRSRKKQFELLKKFKIKEFETPGGGCLLTYEGYSSKLRDLLKNNRKASMEDIRILKFGRHFRSGKNKIIVGKNEEDNKKLLKLRGKDDYKFEMKKAKGPITILQGPKTKKAIVLAASFTLSHSNKSGDKEIVKYGREKFNNEIIVNKIKQEEIEKLRI